MLRMVVGVVIACAPVAGAVMSSARPAAQSPTRQLPGRGWGPLRWAALALNAAIMLVYVWSWTAGQMTSVPEYLRGTYYYDLQADGFRHGHTYLAVEPPPELLALPDPYDAVANEPYRLHDAILYHGKYYLYWGPGPALLVVPLKWLGVHGVLDGSLTVVFVCGSLVFSTLLILTIWERWYADVPWRTCLAGIAVAGLGVPVLIFPPSHNIYGGNEAGGTFFLLGGLYWLVRALGRRPRAAWPFGMAGFWLALAIGTRVSFVMAVAALAVVVAWRLYETNPPGTGWPGWSLWTWFATPLVLGGLGLGWYNYVRFGSWTDFGVSYQLNGGDRLLRANFFGAQNILPNLYNYFLRPVYFQAEYPWLGIEDPNKLHLYPAWVGVHEYYTYNGPCASVFLLSPFLWLAFVPLALPLVRALRRLWPRSGAPPPRPEAPGWLILSLLGTSVLGILPTVFLPGSGPNYLIDATPTLVLLAAIGAWQGYRWTAGPKGRCLWSAVVGALSFLSVLAGMYLGTTWMIALIADIAGAPGSP